MAGDEAARRLLDRERANLKIFGYGVKGFTLSMIETAIEASGGTVSAEALQEIVESLAAQRDPFVDFTGDVVT